MPWCPNCRTEYIDDTGECADCGIPLVEDLPEEEAPADVESHAANDGPPVLLVTAETDIQGDLMAAALDSQGIPVLRKHNGLGGYLKVIMGSTGLGVDLYVPEDRLEAARETLEATGLWPDAGEPDPLAPPKTFLSSRHRWMSLFLDPTLVSILVLLLLWLASFLLD